MTDRKKPLLIVATSPIYAEDGYKARVEMEIGILHEYFNITLLLPKRDDKELVFAADVNRLFYRSFYGNKLRLFLAGAEIRKRVSEFCNDNKEAIIYGEALLGSYFAATSKTYGSNVIFDCHGAEPYEQKMQGDSLKNHILSMLFKSYERSTVKRAGCIVTVTDAMYLLLKTEKKYVKLPMLPSSFFLNEGEKRIETRQKLGIPADSTVFVYSGGNAVWQMCRETVELYKRIETDSTFLLVLTNAEDYFKELIRNTGIKHYAVMKAAYEEVPSFLDAADFGFCIRSDNPVNNVASPTKILEYLSRNVKPVITGCIGDFSSELGNRNLACILDNRLSNTDTIIKQKNFNGIQFVKEQRAKYICGYVEMLSNM